MNRKKLIEALIEASCGLSKTELIEQSHSFVFTGGKLVTFNDELKYSATSPLGDLEAAVPAADLLKMLNKLPDEEVEVSLTDGEPQLVVKGKRRQAGMTVSKEILLAVQDIPAPGKWSALPEELPVYLRGAAETCGTQFSEPLTTMVNVTPKRVQACDNERYYRADVDTGFTKPVLLPAAAVEAVCRMNPVKVSVGDAWAHFLLPSKAVVSVRASHEKYHDGVDQLLDLGDKVATVKLPANFADMLDRATVMCEAGYDGCVSLRLDEGMLTLTARKDGGWYKERKAVQYSGPALAFAANPRFLHEVLAKTLQVQVGRGRAMITLGVVRFVVCLDMGTKPAEPEAD